MLSLPTEQDTLAFGAALAMQARRGDIIALTGPLGAGKTTLARGFIQRLAGREEEVVSPTFTLVQVYETATAPVWHFDLYRLDKPEEVIELGFEEALVSGISLIEWPERLGPMLLSSRLDVRLSLPAQGGRLVEISGDATWTDRIAKVVSHVRGA
jgi:tRNA threonylcarbamoyladenosine biosynthesis protein TsaE